MDFLIGIGDKQKIFGKGVVGAYALDWVMKKVNINGIGLAGQMVKEPKHIKFNITKNNWDKINCFEILGISPLCYDNNKKL